MSFSQKINRKFKLNGIEFDNTLSAATRFNLSVRAVNRITKDLVKSGRSCFEEELPVKSIFKFEKVKDE